MNYFQLNRVKEIDKNLFNDYYSSKVLYTLFSVYLHFYSHKTANFIKLLQLQKAATGSVL